ncbi:hypothetical protein Tco_0276074 [Tanacetum coccineum]
MGPPVYLLAQQNLQPFYRPDYEFGYPQGKGKTFSKGYGEYYNSQSTPIWILLLTIGLGLLLRLGYGYVDAIKDLIEEFCSYTRLLLYYNKSTIIFGSVNDEKRQLTKRIGVKDCKSLVGKVKGRVLSQKSKCLSYAGRLQLASDLESIHTKALGWLVTDIAQKDKNEAKRTKPSTGMKRVQETEAKGVPHDPDTSETFGSHAGNPLHCHWRMGRGTQSNGSNDEILRRLRIKGQDEKLRTLLEG